MFSAINWDPSGVLFDLGFFQIRYYSLMFVIAFVMGWYITKAIFNREGISIEKLDKLFIYSVIAILLGARLGHFLFYEPEAFIQRPLEVILPFKFSPFRFVGFSGLASHGAAIAMIIAMFLYRKKHLPKPTILWLLDRVVLPVSLGAVFVRIGNFMNSEIIGKPTNSDYGVIFRQLNESFPRHPAQLYEAFGYLIVFGVLMFTYWKTDKFKKEGYIFGLFLVLLMTVRFFVEFLKEAQVEERADNLLNTGQLLSIPFIIIGLYFMFRKPKNS